MDRNERKCIDKQRKLKEYIAETIQAAHLLQYRVKTGQCVMWEKDIHKVAFEFQQLTKLINEAIAKLPPDSGDTQ